MFDIESWRQKQLRQLTNQSKRGRAAALASHNLTYGAGLTQGGGYTSAAENIARGEALESAGVNEEAAQMQHERQMELDAIERQKEEEKKARKQGLIKGIVGLGLNLVGAPILKGGTSILGAGLGKLGLTGMKEAEQTIAGTTPVPEIPMSQSAPVNIPQYQAPIQVGMAQQYAPKGGVQSYFSNLLKRKKKPVSPYNVPDVEDTRPWYLK